MKHLKYILVCFFYCFCLSIFGQIGFKAQSIIDYDILDKSNLRIAYSLDYVWNIEKPLSKYSDVLYLDVGKKLSKSYSYMAYQVDSLVTDQTLKGDMSPYKSAKEALPMKIYKNYLERELEVVYRSPDSNVSDFLYSDDYCSFDWQIHSDKKTILGYLCQKATTTFRGRIWEAWFTTEIPISDGPWKFCGLSGLILEVSDSQKHYVFTCTGIEKKQVPIVMYDWGYEKITREKLNTYLIRIYENPKSYFESTGVMVIIENKSNRAFVSLPYNPIERE